MPFSLFLALKYLKPKRSFVSAVTVISIIGVLLGVAVLVIVLSVMSGFDDMWRNKILAFNAHLTVGGCALAQDPTELAQRIMEVPGVRGAAPYVQGLVFAQHQEAFYTPVFRGVDPEQETLVSEVPKSIREGSFTVDDETVVVGRDLAMRLVLKPGDTVLLYSPHNFISQEELRLPDELTVGGIFELGMWEYDMGFILGGMETARDLFGLSSGAEEIHVMTDDPFKAAQVAERVKTVLGPGYTVTTWMERHRSLFGALQVEKNIMFFLLIFITLVAAFGITNTLITETVQKTREIGLLKAVGFSRAKIMGIFLWQGLIQGVIGTACGIGSGLLVLRFRNNILGWLNRYTNFELFPKQLYRLNELPAHTAVLDVVVVAVCVLTICTLAGLIPAYRASRFDPVRALRYE